MNNTNLLLYLIYLILFYLHLNLFIKFCILIFNVDQYGDTYWECEVKFKNYWIYRHFHKSRLEIEIRK